MHKLTLYGQRIYYMISKGSRCCIPIGAPGLIPSGNRRLHFPASADPGKQQCHSGGRSSILSPQLVVTWRGNCGGGALKFAFFLSLFLLAKLKKKRMKKENIPILQVLLFQWSISLD